MWMNKTRAKIFSLLIALLLIAGTVAIPSVFAEKTVVTGGGPKDKGSISINVTTSTVYVGETVHADITVTAPDDGSVPSSVSVALDNGSPGTVNIELRPENWAHG